MKPLKIIILFLCIVFTSLVFSQEAVPVSQTITVDTKDLTPEQLAKIKSQQELKTLQEKLDTYGDWVGVGSEIGNGVKEALNAVVDVSDKFSKTDVGKFTMVMVAWKIIGKDIIRIFLGIVFVIILSTFTYKNLRKMYSYKIVTKDNGWKFWLPKEYTIITPETYDGYDGVKFAYILLLMSIFGIAYAIMFA